jgi:hypothetical protein
MSWARLEPGYFRNAKVSPLSKDAKLLDLAGIAFSADNLRDGVLTLHDVRMAGAEADVDDVKVAVAELEATGRWHRVLPARVPACECRRGADPQRPNRALRPDDFWQFSPDGWLIHDYLIYNPMRDEVLAERSAAAERMRRVRAGRRPPNGTDPERKRAKAATADEQAALPDEPADAEPAPTRATERSGEHQAEREPARATGVAVAVPSKFALPGPGPGLVNVSGSGTGLRTSKPHAHTRASTPAADVGFDVSRHTIPTDVSAEDDGLASPPPTSLIPGVSLDELDELRYRLQPFSGEFDDANLQSSITWCARLMVRLHLPHAHFDNAIKEAAYYTRKRLADLEQPRVQTPMAYFLGAVEQKATARAQHLAAGEPAEDGGSAYTRATCARCGAHAVGCRNDAGEQLCWQCVLDGESVEAICTRCGSAGNVACRDRQGRDICTACYRDDLEAKTRYHPPRSRPRARRREAAGDPVERYSRASA